MSVSEDVAEMIKTSVRGGMSHEEARRRFSRHFDSSDVEEVLNDLRRTAHRVRTMHKARALLGQSGNKWYTGPDAERDECWPALKRYLLSEKEGFDEEVVSEINDESTKIVASLGDPSEPRFSTRGLVVGYVQSGKTANFTAVMAKAADAGYGLFIVLAGVTNSLRRQTQRRLNRELVSLNEELWRTATNLEEDFSLSSGGNVNAHLTSRSHQRTLIVAKKNKFVLEDLVTWLRSAEESVAQGCPVLVIDDEADYASVNTSRDEEERTSINQLIVDLLKSMPQTTYVGYTATPFANVFVNPREAQDLYPRDFIISLPEPDGYFGAETIFGRDQLVTDEEGEAPNGHDMVRYVDEAELTALRPEGKDQDHETFQPEATESLRAAIRYFALATAARRVRADADTGSPGFHSTMMVHTSHYTNVQNRLGELIEGELRQLEAQVKREDGALFSDLRRRWEKETDRVPASEFGLSTVGFDQLAPELAEVCAGIQPLVLNNESDDELVYSEDPEESDYYLIVGGNVLSRGLTLEGLIVSFFVRESGTYDALLQMGRWFGYWQDYADLPRLWMISKLEDQFRDLAKVEQEIRQDIARYAEEGRTPLNFAVQVPMHPHLAITSRGKRRHTEEIRASYSGREMQTTRFYHRDRKWLERNWRAGRHLLEEAQRRGCEVERRSSERGWLVRGVPNSLICEFCGEYQFHPDHKDLNRRELQEFIKRQDRAGRIRHWSVAVAERSDEKLGTADLNLPEEVSLVQRTRDTKRNVDSKTADVGALISEDDLGADLEEEKIGHGDSPDPKRIREFREGNVKDRGLLLFYPVSKDSSPAEDSETRAPLEAVHHILGVGFVFPSAEDAKADKYRRVILPDVA